MDSPGVQEDGARRTEVVPEEEAHAATAPVAGVDHAVVTREVEVIPVEGEVGHAVVSRAPERIKRKYVREDGGPHWSRHSTIATAWGTVVPESTSEL